jgi:alanine racemase
MAVVKADGYGHGAVAVAHTALACGAQRLAVARLGEARRLRAAGIAAPVLLFGALAPGDVKEALELELTLAVSSLPLAEALATEARRLGGRLRVHLKVDTGMGRLGFQPRGLNALHPEAAGDIVRVVRLPGLECEGIFTHFANADNEDKRHAWGQFALFQELLQRLHSQGVAFALRHAANSAALIEMPATHLDLVRPGIAIYGFYPSEALERSRIDLRPAMRLISTIIQVKQVPPGFAVSYGSTHVTAQPATIATVPIGYADGYNRRLSSRGQMLVHGVRAPILGRVCMDLTMIDVSHIPQVAEGDEAVLFGSQGDACLPADELAARLDTIHYEIVSAITSRVPRVYRGPVGDTD